MKLGRSAGWARVEILATDLARLRRAVARPPEDLVVEVARRGGDAAAVGPPGDRPAAVAGAAPPVEPFRRALSWRAAVVSVHRQDYATQREWFRGAAARERSRYEEKLILDRDLLPPLKAEALALRKEIRQLERELLAAGVDPGGVEPLVNWDRTLAVESNQTPRFESNEERRARTVAFFRRID